jgi:hypothetical protein
MIADVLAGHTADLYVTGGCVGVDEAIATMLCRIHPESAQRIMVPHNRDLVDQYWLTAIGKRSNVEVIYMPAGSTYRDRNLAILGDFTIHGYFRHIPDLLIGFPPFPEKDPRMARSGTWQTIHLARYASPPIPADVHILTQERSEEMVE